MLRILRIKRCLGGLTGSIRQLVLNDCRRKASSIEDSRGCTGVRGGSQFTRFASGGSRSRVAAGARRV